MEKLNIGQALKDVADSLEKLIPAINTIGVALLEAQEAKEAEQPKEDKHEGDKALTLEDVRAALAAKSRAGHTEEIKALFKKYGADRLSGVDQSNYAALMADAEGIKDE